MTETQKKEMKRSRALVIMNPKSGSSFSRVKIFFSKILSPLIGTKNVAYKSIDSFSDELSLALTKVGIHSKFEITNYKGHAKKFAEKIDEKQIDVVIVVGGDGTLNEVVNGMIGKSIPIVLVPMGTANVFSLSLGLSTDIPSLCQQIATNEAKLVDVGKVGDRYFLSMCGIGVDAYIIQKVEKGLKKYLGVFSYLLVLIYALFRFPFDVIHFKMDESDLVYSGVFVVVSNIPYYGGKLALLPKANPSDGVLDVIIFKQKNIFKAIQFLWRMKLNLAQDLRYVSYYQAKSLRVLNPEEHKYHVDAEYVGKAPETIEMGTPISLILTS